LSTNLYKKKRASYSNWRIHKTLLGFKEIKGKEDKSAHIWWKSFIGPIVLNLAMIDYSQSF